MTKGQYARQFAVSFRTALVVALCFASGSALAQSESAPASPRTTKPPVVEVAKTATCGCCRAWVQHMQESGFEASARNLTSGALAAYKKKSGIPPRLASCHTAKVGGYVIEGHVPAKEVQRLLRESPDAIGLSVPGMPIGSPGMEVGNRRNAYEVLLVKRDGSTSVFASYAAKE